MKSPGILAAVLVLTVAACADADSDTQAATDLCIAGEVDGDLHILNWTDYIPHGALAHSQGADDLLDLFESEHGVDVTLTEYESSEAMMTLVRDGRAAYDLVVVSDYMVSSMSEGGLLVGLNKSALPNLSNLDREFVELPVDPGGEFTVPYQWGATGIGFSHELQVDEGSVSWGLIFDPEQRAQQAGAITLLDDPRETLGAALKFLGYSLNTTSFRELEEAGALVADAKDDLLTFTSAGYGELLVTGEIFLAHGWSSDFLTVFELATDDGYDAWDHFGFAIPEEGGAVWVDTMAIPMSADSPCTAHAFINFILEAEHAATLTNYTRHASPNVAAMPFINDDILANEAIYPPRSLLEDGSLEFLADLGDFAIDYEETFLRSKS